jgi:hypothetical protein
MQFQGEAPQSLTQLAKERHGIRVVLKPNDKIIDKAYDDNIAPRMPRPPLLDPEVEDVVQ